MFSFADSLSSPAACRPVGRPTLRLGFTIVEMLIAMAVTLLMMVALGRMFQSVGRGMQDSRANVEMSARLRTVAFRLKDELSRCTASMTPPSAGGEGSGYLVYYDGPMNDASTLLLTTPTALTDEQLVDYRATGKFGDFDDYLAFTAVAEGDAYFTGVVPDYLLNPGSATPLALTPTSSKYAEIIYWMQPVSDAGGIIDRDNDLIPDRMNLHRRVLLIRPDLNNPTTGRLPLPGPLPGSSPSPANIPMSIRRYDGSTIAATGAPQYHYNDGWPGNYRQLLEVFQDCDLSVRRSLSEEAGFEGLPQPRSTSSNSPADPRSVVANSLKDLTKPENRFAHVRIPGGVDAMNGVGSAFQLTSMPVLDLAGPTAFVLAAQANGLLSRPVETTSGFLSPDYTLRGNRAGEDIVLPGMLSFDVKAFDPEAPVLIHAGPDGIAGSTGDPADFGMLGSDDVVLTPSDPGFYPAIRSPTPANFVVGSRGAFVDLDYVYKAAGAVQAPASLTGDLATHLVNLCNTPFSGFDRFGAPGAFRFPTALAKSGRYIPGTNPLFYQPAFDTYAADYEYDGFNQAPVTGLGGTVWWVPPFPGTAANPAPVDEGNNGLDDDNAGGVDDAAEKETSPPFLAPLRALQINLRIEDTGTRQVRQMLVTQEFIE